MYIFLNAIKIFFLNLFETDKDEKNFFFRLSLSLLSIIIILILINFVIYSIYPNNSEALRFEAEKLIHPLYHLWIEPEPIERFQILTSLILMPLLIVCSIKIFSLKLFSRISISNHIYFVNLALCFSFLGILFYLAFKINNPNFINPEITSTQLIRSYFITITSDIRFVVAIVFYPLITYFIINGTPEKYKKFINIILYLFLSTILLCLFLLSIFNSDNYLGAYNHLNAVLYPISQVQQGKSLLFDLSAVYGLYPHFLYPIFKLMNVNVISFSLTMSALTTISYSLIFLGLRKIINNSLVTFLAFIAILYFSYIAFFLWPYPINGNFDIYHAYKPIRMFFPAIILYSVFSYILAPNRNLYLLITFISSLSILWNFDSGVICFLSFYIYILYERLIGNNVRGFTQDFIKHTFISSVILALTILLFSCFTYFVSNSIPDWSLFLQYPIIFSSAHYFSLPLPLFNAWNLIFLVYLYGIYIGFHSILFGKKDAIDRIVFFVAIFGVGISTYYLNRSHDSNLFATLYPSFILLAIFLSKLLNKNNRAHLFQIKNLSIVMMISFIFVLTLFQTIQPNKIINILSKRIPDIINSKLSNQIISDGISLVNFNAQPNDQVAIISEYDGIIHLETKTSAPFSSPGTDLHQTHVAWDTFKNSLTNNRLHKVFISGDVYKSGKTPDLRYVEIMKIFGEHYYLDDWVGAWRMFISKKYKPVTPFSINASASYSKFCPNNSLGCNNTVKNFNSIENFPKNTKFIKIDFNLSAPITVQSIMLHVIMNKHIIMKNYKFIEKQYAGTSTTLPIQGLDNIGILNNEYKKFVNTDERSNQLGYKVNQKFSILVPENNYMDICTVFKVELTYNNNNKINVRVPCKTIGKQE